MTAYLQYESEPGRGAVVITGYSGDFENILIPEQIGRSKVTKIAASAFFGHDELLRVSLPDGLRLIGSYAFASCTKLEYINLPESLETLDACAFRSCEKLDGVVLPATLKTLGTGAFEGCASLTSIAVPETVTSLGAETFAYCSSLENVTLPTGMTSIGEWAFFGCDSLKTLSLPAVTSIGERAFYTWNGSAYVPISGLTITVNMDSYAENYCLRRGIRSSARPLGTE